MKKIKVMIADNYPMIRKGLKQLLDLEDEIEVIAQASNGRETVDFARIYNPDVILVDINMLELNGLQAIEILKETNCPSKIIILTSHEDREYLIKALKLGAQGYVLKDTEPDVLAQAIRAVSRGKTYIQQRMTKERINEFAKITNINWEKNDETRLTKREIEVLELIAEGKLNKEIARELYISEKTVKNHVSNIFRKLKVTDRTQAAIYAYKHNIKITK